MYWRRSSTDVAMRIINPSLIAVRYSATLPLSVTTSAPPRGHHLSPLSPESEAPSSESAGLPKLAGRSAALPRELDERVRFRVPLPPGESSDLEVVLRSKPSVRLTAAVMRELNDSSESSELAELVVLRLWLVSVDGAVRADGVDTDIDLVIADVAGTGGGLSRVAVAAGTED